MALGGSGKYRSAWDLTSGIKMLLYGQSGTGKTTLWATFTKPILALICSGGSRPGELRSIDTPEYRKTIDARVVTHTEQVGEMLADAGNFATVVMDHASGLQDLTLKEILGIDELPAQKGWGMASQQQYGQSTLQSKEILRALLSLPANVVVVAQERVFNNDTDGGSEVIAPTIGAALTPSLTGWLNISVDYICQTFKRGREEVKKAAVAGKEGKTVDIRVKLKGVDYVLRTEPDAVYQTKFRLPRGTVLENIVDPTFDKINALIQGGR